MNLKIQNDLLSDEYAEFRRDVAVKNLSCKNLKGNDNSLLKSDKYKNSKSYDRDRTGTTNFKSADTLDENFRSGGMTADGNPGNKNKRKNMYRYEYEYKMDRIEPFKDRRNLSLYNRFRGDINNKYNNNRRINVLKKLR